MANYSTRKMLLPASDKRTFGTMTPKTIVIHNGLKSITAGYVVQNGQLKEITDLYTIQNGKLKQAK